MQIQRKKQFLFTCIALVVSTFVAVLVAEISARLFLNVNPFSKMKLRYTVNSVESFAPGFYSRSSNYPIENKGNLDIIYSEIYARPLEVNIKTNDEGQRITHPLFNPETLIVGDSIVFGYGASDEDTIGYQMNSLNALNGVDALAVSGWGPASYMKSVNEQIKKRQYKNIYIFYALTNDDQNLENSCWENLKDKLPPSGQIKRNDIPTYAVYAPPNFIITSPLRHLSLSRLMYDGLIDFGEGKRSDLYRKPKRTIDREKYIERAILAHDALKRGYCVENEDIFYIDRIIGFLENNNIQSAEKTSRELSRKLAERECAPIVGANNFAMDNKFRRMNYAFVSRYQFLELSLHDHPASLKADYCKINGENNDLKKEILINWLNNLAESYSVSIFLIPPEFNLSSSKDNHWLCKPEERLYGCHNLTRAIAEHYDKKNNALFLDGVHLNGDGAKLVRDQVLKRHELRSVDAGSK